MPADENRPPTASGPRPVASLDALLGGYAPPRPTCPIDLQLSGNEGLEPPTELLEALRGGFPDAVRRYPHTDVLEGRLAHKLGVDPEQVLVTAGADEALDRICRAFLAPGRVAVVPEPTFEMLPRYVALTGATMRSVPWLADPYPTGAVLEACDDPAMVAVVTPNNPTGLCADAGTIERLARERPDALVLVDAAYAEFADDDPSLAALAHRNVVVTRTLSKAWGLAGLRVGYAVGHPDTIRCLRATASPFPVSGPSLALACDWIDGEGERSMRSFVGAIAAERQRLGAALERHGFAVWWGQGNFVTARCLDRPERAHWLRDGLAGLGIGVRVWPGREHLEGAVRITCPGNDRDLARVLAALDTVLTPRAVDEWSALARSAGDPEPGAWAFVHTAEDAGSARLAGCLPLGLAPGRDPAAAGSGELDLLASTCVRLAPDAPSCLRPLAPLVDLPSNPFLSATSSPDR